MNRGISKSAVFAVAAIFAVLSESAAQDCSGAGFKAEDAGEWTTASFKVLFQYEQFTIQRLSNNKGTSFEKSNIITPLMSSL